MNAPAIPCIQGLKQEDNLKVVIFDDEKGLYRDPVNNFIVRMRSDDIIEVIGVLQSSNNIRPLTDKEKITATQIGLVIA
jgi:hypothetical protein